METLPNFHALEISFVSPTENIGGRVRIKSNRFRQSVIISFDASGKTYETGQNWLEQQGFTLVGQAEGKDCYIILSSTFKPLK